MTDPARFSEDGHEEANLRRRLLCHGRFLNLSDIKAIEAPQVVCHHGQMPGERPDLCGSIKPDMVTNSKRLWKPRKAIIPLGIPVKPVPSVSMGTVAADFCPSPVTCQVQWRDSLGVKAKPKSGRGCIKCPVSLPTPVVKRQTAWCLRGEEGLEASDTLCVVKATGTGNLSMGKGASRVKWVETKFQSGGIP